MAMRAISSLVLFMTCVGCLYIPTLEHNTTMQGHEAISKETIQSIVPGKSTRSDVLLLLGSPSNRRDNDQYFIYRWKTTSGMLALPGGGADVFTDHAFCLEFYPNAVVKRHKHIESSLFGALTSKSSYEDDLEKWFLENEK